MPAMGEVLAHVSDGALDGREDEDRMVANDRRTID
jgi:hypothetical protein